jgi:hypothetical protein
VKPYGTWEDAKPVAEVILGLLEQGLNREEIANTLNRSHIPQRAGAWTRENVNTLTLRAERRELELPGDFDPWHALDILFWEALELPQVDYTDNGFNWTEEELAEAALLAKHLVRYKPHYNSTFEKYIKRQEKALNLDSY